MTIAIFDTGAGFLQWIGEADSHAAAIRALDKEVGLYETSADREDVLAYSDEDSLLVYDLSSDEAVAVRAWSDAGGKAGTFPVEEGGVTYTRGEVLEIATAK